MFEQIYAVASVIITIALLVLVVVAARLASHFRKTYNKINDLLDRVYGDISPIMHQVHSISENVNFISTSVRADVQKVGDTIDAANARVQQAVAVTEHRLNDFNALLAVVQEEAEQVFLSTAATVRGVRRGAAAFRRGRGTDLASDEFDEADLAEDVDTQLERQEDGHGNDNGPKSAAQALPAAPRIRPRARSPRRT